MMVAIKHCQSDLASSDDGGDGDDEDEETQQGKLSEDDEPGGVMGTITKTVQQRMDMFWQLQKKLDKLTQPRLDDTADFFRERGKKYGTSDLRVLAVVQLQTDADAVAPVLKTLGELMEFLDIVPGISQMLQGTSRPGSIHISLGLVMPQSNTSIPGFLPAVESDWSTLLKLKPIEPVSFYHSIMAPAKHYIDFGCGRRHAEGSWVCGGIYRQTAILMSDLGEK